MIEIVDKGDGAMTMKRTNNGFNPLELLGICEDVKTEVLMQMGRYSSIMDKELIHGTGAKRTIKNKNKSND